MRYKNILDLHTHSDNSPDADHSVSLMCEYAVKNGVRGLAVTDHCECNAYIRDGYNITSAQSLFESGKARAVFSGQLVVLIGVELGQATQDLEAANKVLSRPSLDFVLASMHNLQDRKDFYYLDYSLPENDPKILLEEYFNSLLDLVAWGGFDSLAHLTYPLRYLPGKGYALSDYTDIIDAIFRALIETGKALEINTSGLRQGLGTTLPDLALVRRYRELGGELITIGSDAHRAPDVGDGIPDGMALAQEAGFRYITLFQGRIPTPIRIE
ncbi:MAG: histidinol-phosphatase HisJ family protein [Candidatus Howiella sp.]